MSGTTGYPPYNHVVLCIMENHGYSSILGDTTNAPYINSLAQQGTVLTNYFAEAHPSEPNYFILYAGDTFGIADDNDYSEPDPSLYTALQAVGATFVGYAESGSPRKHNPWESFPEGTTVEKDFASSWPASNFNALPSVSFVIPNLNDDMHDGTVAQGDSWLQANVDSYVQWAKTNNSLFILTFDEDDSTGNNQVLTIVVGSGVPVGVDSTNLNHHSTLATVCRIFGATPPRGAATAAVFPSSIFQGGGPTPSPSPVPVPTPSPSPVPSPVPVPPTPSPVPSPVPSPSPVPLPTPQPAPTPVPQATPTYYGSQLQLRINSAHALQATLAGNYVAGGGMVGGGDGTPLGSALPSSTSYGFLYIPAISGPPTGTPTEQFPGTVPIVFDTSTKTIRAYNNGAWDGAAASPVPSPTPAPGGGGSPSGTTVSAGSTGTITDAQGNRWNLDTVPPSVF